MSHDGTPTLNRNLVGKRCLIFFYGPMHVPYKLIRLISFYNYPPHVFITFSFFFFLLYLSFLLSSPSLFSFDRFFFVYLLLIYDFCYFFFLCINYFYFLLTTDTRKPWTVRTDQGNLKRKKRNHSFNINWYMYIHMIQED